MHKVLARFIKRNQPIGRAFTRFPDDVMIISYPRSGNTWLRFLLGYLRAGEGVTFATLEEVVPDIYLNSDRALRAVPRPRILKSHEPFDPTYPRVIYLIRDPRDVAISYYHYLVKTRDLDESHPISDFIDSFIAGSLQGYGSWENHVRSWTTRRQTETDFFQIRYEDLLADPFEGLRAMAKFVPLPDDGARIRGAVASAEVSVMQRLERTTASGWRTLSGSRPTGSFVRIGERGTGVRELPPESIAAIESAWGDTMRSLGYSRPSIQP